MIAEAASINGQRKKYSLADAVRLVLPREHGSWSLALEPIALGLLVAPSRAGVLLAVAASAGFFLRRPAKILLAAADPRRSLATLCAGILLCAAVAGLLFAGRLGGMVQLWPLLPAAIAGALFIWFDARNASRGGAAEITGAATFALLPATFATLAGWPAQNALALAAVMLARSVPTVMLIRVLLRRAKGQVVSTGTVLLTVGAATVMIFWLGGQALLPRPVTAISVLLLSRALWYLSPARFPLTARQLGFLELFLGVMFLLIAVLAWHL